MRGTVLLAREKRLERDQLGSYLRKQGWLVVSTGDGRQASEIINRQGRALDMLVVDLMLPGVSGLSLAESLRSVQPSAKILIISEFWDLLPASSWFSFSPPLGAEDLGRQLGRLFAETVVG